MIWLPFSTGTGLEEWVEWLLAFLSWSCRDGEVGADPHSSLPGRLMLELNPIESISILSMHDKHIHEKRNSWILQNRQHVFFKNKCIFFSFTHQSSLWLSQKKKKKNPKHYLLSFSFHEWWLHVTCLCPACPWAHMLSLTEWVTMGTYSLCMTLWMEFISCCAAECMPHPPPHTQSQDA